MAVTKTRFIKALREDPNDGRTRTDLFVVQRKTLSTSSRNQPYLRLTLADRSGSMDAFVWDDAAEYARQFREGDLLCVTFRVRTRNDMVQMHVETLTSLSEKDLQAIRWEDFRPGLDEAARTALWTETTALLDSLQTPALQQLVQTYLKDPAFQRAYLDAPAAKGFHHAYVGGLATHTLAVMRLAQAVSGLYSGGVDPDVLLVGAFLHDLGKLEELSNRTGSYTDEGRLLGHIMLGAHTLRRRAETIHGFPADLLTHLEHMVLSHHGQKEWGSPVEPQTLEAIVLNFLDNLDAKLAGAREWLEAEDVREGEWSGFWKGLGRHLFRAPSARVEFQEEHPDVGMADIERAFLLRESQEKDAAEPVQPPAQERAAGQREFKF